MSATPRSSGGCWTCRVRRKKCDEANPVCLTCTSLQVPCYGYGPKPDWMDRGVREREVATVLRDTVKQTLSLQRKGLSLPSRGAGTTQSVNPLQPALLSSVPILEASSANDISHTNILLPEASSSTDPRHSTTPLDTLDTGANPTAANPQDIYSGQKHLQYVAPEAIGISGTARNGALDLLLLTDESWSIPPEQFEEDQAGLLMHFFDHVLPLQFRFYNPSIVEGGRGWFLSILTRTKPLYQVALSLAAYHQQSILVRSDTVQCPIALAKLQERHIECIKVLRCHLEKFSIGARTDSFEDKIEIMACIILLIALELFRGDTCDWQMHLQAASTMSHHFCRNELKKAATTHAHQLAMEFFIGVITWYDILSCASTGLKPFSIVEIVNDDSCPRIRLEKLMGCENWVMSLILEIATLDEWKRRLEASDGLSMWELSRRAADIEMQLEIGLLKSSGHLNETPTDLPTAALPANTLKPPVREITRIFASAALVYLHVTISGPHPGVAEIRQGVSSTMTALDALKDKDMVRHLLWPVCIAGCMTTVEHESYWRGLVSGMNGDRWSFGHPSKVLKIMEECWSLRKCQPGAAVAVDWMTAMKNLHMRVLLV